MTTSPDTKAAYREREKFYTEAIRDPKNHSGLVFELAYAAAKRDALASPQLEAVAQQPDAHVAVSIPPMGKDTS